MSKNNQHMQRRTKIIATLGPATNTVKVLENIIHEGVDIVRLNFSHGKHSEHQKWIQMVREAAEKQDRVIGILADLQCPKIRIASLKNREIILKVGSVFTLDAQWDEKSGDEKRVGIDYKALPQDVQPHDILLLDDGRLKLTVQAVNGAEIICQVKVGGVLSSHKGINRQGGGLSAPALTEKDMEDLQFALQQNVDYVAISFPRHAKDMLKAKKFMREYEGEGSAGIIAKIERAEAVNNIDEIIEASDGVMVARGDLAVEIGDAEVPLVQKNIIQRARALNKPVIIATQMMESMVDSTVPTRAEISDVANAVLDNTDAVMLSAESAVGKNPALVVAAMSRACVVSEQLPHSQKSRHRVECRFERIDEAIAMATMYTANHLSIKAIITLTESGATSLWMSRIRTAIPIYGLSRYRKTLGRMSLYRGVYPVAFDPTQYTRDETNRKAIEVMQQDDVLHPEDLVILTKGDFMGIGGGSNAMKILKVGEVV